MKEKPIRPWYIAFNTLFIIINVLITAAYLLSAFSGRISPEKHVYAAYFGLFFPLFFFVQLCMTLFWLLRTRWIYFFANLLVFLITWSAMSTYLPLHKPSLESDLPANRIKLLSYNVMGFNFEKHSATEPNSILKYIKGSDADIVCLQEAALSKKGSKYVSMEVLRSYLSEYKYVHHGQAQGDKGSSLMLLSKYPILSAQAVDYNSAFNGSMAYTLRIDDENVLLINNHLESFRLTMDDGREYLKLAREGDATSLRSKMTAKLGPAYVRRAKQIEKVKAYIEHAEEQRILVCGDFNDTPISYATQSMRTMLKDAYVHSGYGPGITFDRGAFIVRIDHIFVSPNYEVYNAKVDASIKSSDHYPIYTYISKK